MDNTDISVIIPVKNSQRYLDAALKAVFTQEINFKFEVIVIDSGSTDNSLNIITAYPVRLYRINEREFNHGLTRNYGAARAQGKYIIFMTPDAVPCNNRWMQRLIDDLESDQQAAGVYSRQIPRRDSCPLVQLRVNRFFTAGEEKTVNQINDPEDYRKLPPNEKYRFCNFDNVSSCIRRTVWEKIPFPKTDFAEDLEWSKKALEAGYKIIYEPESIVFHAHDFSIRGWYRRNRLNARKLFMLFRINSVCNPLQLFALTLIYTFRDIGILCRQGKFKAVLSNIPLIPLYAFSGLFGQYRGSRDL
jgi:rhamnosyltransferase